ncbi:alpha/beta hydrolase family protein [Actinocorallia longicatena]
MAASAALGLGLLSVTGQAVAAAPVPADDGGKIIERVQIDAQTVDITIDTPLIDSEDPKVRIIVPVGWSARAKRTWPVLTVLTGGPSDYLDWVNKTDLEVTSKAGRAIVVMPSGGRGQGYTNWYNKGKFGNPKWETFHTKELSQLIERNFRGGTSRAVMGISSGGQGGVTYAARNPGFYKYVASYSGIVHTTKPGIPAMMMLTDFGDAESTLKDPFDKWGNPLTDRMNWMDHDPYVLADRLRGTGLYLSAGNGDQGPLDKGLLEQIGSAGTDGAQTYILGSISERLVGMTNQDLVAKLKALGIPVTASLYGPGFHQWGYWDREYKKAWPLIMKAIGA